MTSRPTTRSAHRWARAGVVVAASAATVALSVLPASAHIRVSSTDAAQGGTSILTFRVPTEKDNASTVAVQVFLPADQPISFASAQPHPGWTAVVHKRTLPQPLQTDDGPVTQVTSDIVWTADNPDSGIKPDQFDTFAVLAGPLPTTAELTVPATQTYSDGEVVAWNQTAAPGAPEPEHPAPSLKLAPGSGGGGGMAGMGGSASSGSSGPAVAAASQDTPTDAGSSDSSGPATPLAITALVIAVIALLGLALAVLRGRRS